MTDALRNPTHKLLASDGHASGDLLLVDRAHTGTVFRTCVRRDNGRAARALRTCFATTSGDAGLPTLTPLRFRRGRYVVTWTVAGATVARWRFTVV